MGYQNELHEFLRQAQEITVRVQEASAGMADREVNGTCEGGSVRVAMTSSGDVRSVRIEPRAVNLDNLRRLETLVAEAMQDALNNVRGVAQQVMQPLTDDLNRLIADDPQ
ncbi:YbaB/EbfC family nucleoid-associated protein [Actinoplanes sp. NPDC051346]|uniref:YbaB/EbfC family nucleoid-associated protein n=1 Tax=Actinoplanes sp. NPDC051346 TaxID=3155048 RepID=UPI003425802D